MASLQVSMRSVVRVVLLALVACSACGCSKEPAGGEAATLPGQQGGHDRKREPHAEMIAAATAGDAEAQFRLGEAYYTGQGVALNEADAVKWWRPAAEQGHIKAQYRLGMALLIGRGVEKNAVEAREWLSRAKEQEELLKKASRDADGLLWP